ncbi:MAG: carboxylating nicotinate-nucleotide diphosphorylase [Nitrososphaeraceae archaeon]
MTRKLYDYLELRKTLENFIQEDLGTGDVTSENLRFKDKVVSGVIIYKSKKPGILCGMEESELLFQMFGCDTKCMTKDGMKLSSKTQVMEIKGKAKNILKVERTALNLLMRMSGIATNTRKFLDITRKIDPSILIAATRKTAPGLRIFDKKAVLVGGGTTHRLRLDDMVLIKDNHLQIEKSISKLIPFIKKRVGSSIQIECEVRNLSGALEAINSGANIIMLDNFSPLNVKKTILKIAQLGLRDKVKIEVSGGITLDNISKYAISRPDIISVGQLTHSSPALDFSLKIVN